MVYQDPCNFYLQVQVELQVQGEDHPFPYPFPFPFPCPLLAFAGVVSYLLVVVFLVHVWMHLSHLPHRGKIVRLKALAANKKICTKKKKKSEES